MHKKPTINPPPDLNPKQLVNPDKAKNDGPPFATEEEAKAWIAKRTNQAAIVMGLLKKAVERIDDVFGWPTNVGKYQIYVVDGDKADTTSDPGQITNSSSEQFEGSNLRILIGLDFLNTSFCTRLKTAGISDEKLTTFILSHEIFHLGEVMRQKKCGFMADVVDSGFARAIRPEMNQNWQTIAHELAKFYRNKMTSPIRAAVPPDTRLASAQALVASDTVSEACADLQALHLYEKSYGISERLKIQTPLLAERAADEIASLGNYQIGNSLTACLNNIKELSNHNIVIETWKYAFAQAALAPDCPTEILALINAPTTTLTFDSKLAEVPTERSLYGAAARKFNR